MALANSLREAMSVLLSLLAGGVMIYAKNREKWPAIVAQRGWADNKSAIISVQIAMYSLFEWRIV
jgi:hypothetical protein